MTPTQAAAVALLPTLEDSRGDAWRNAEHIARDLGDAHPATLQAFADAERFDDAVTAIRTIRDAANA